MLIVHIVSSIVHGGVATVVRNLILEQEMYGYNTAVVTAREDTPWLFQWIAENGVRTRIYPIEGYRRRRLTIWGGLSNRTKKRVSADHPVESEIVYHFHNPISVGLLSPIVGIRMLITMHGMQNSKKKLTDLLFRASLKRFTAAGGKIVGCARNVAEYYKKMLNTENVHYVLNGIYDVAKASSKYIDSNGLFHIGFASYLDELKGWEMVVDAFCQLPPETRVKADLYLAGDAALQVKQKLRSIQHQHDEIHYAGYIEDVQTTFLPYLDVLVLPSRTEGLPMVILESLQAGTPVIATPVGGIPEIVVNGMSGWLVERNSDAIREQLTRMISDADYAQQLRKGARMMYKQYCTSTRMSEEYISLYHETKFQQRK